MSSTTEEEVKDGDDNSEETSPEELEEAKTERTSEAGDEVLRWESSRTVELDPSRLEWWHLASIIIILVLVLLIGITFLLPDLVRTAAEVLFPNAV